MAIETQGCVTDKTSIEGMSMRENANRHDMFGTGLVTRTYCNHLSFGSTPILNKGVSSCRLEP